MFGEYEVKKLRSSACCRQDNAIFHLKFTKPGQSLLVVPCTLLEEKWLQIKRILLSREQVLVRGLVKSAPAVASHSYINLPATFSEPSTKTFSQLCI